MGDHFSVADAYLYTVSALDQADEHRPRAFPNLAPTWRASAPGPRCRKR
jgi:glutathione S-transferase